VSVHSLDEIDSYSNYLVHSSYENYESPYDFQGHFQGQSGFPSRKDQKINLSFFSFDNERVLGRDNLELKI